MRVHRRGGAECLEHVHLPRGVVEVIIATDDVRDAHVEVIDHHAEVVGRRAVGARDDEVIELGVLERDRSVHQVLDHDRAVQRILEAHDRA